ncbi:MAG: cytochrome c3 family protein [Symbiobacteriia bacterium]
MKRIRGAAAPAFLAATVAALGLAGWLTLGRTAVAASTADKCLECHEMQQQVQTWHDSSHQNVDCLRCHADPNVKGWWQGNLNTLRRRIVHARGGVSESSISTTVPDSRCLNCHGDQMPYVMGDYAPPAIDAAGAVGRIDTAALVKLPLQPKHDLHLSRVPGVTCTTCHNQVGHGAQSREAAVEASHKTCNNCHRERQVTLAGNSSLTCAACHLDSQAVTPTNHDTAWRLGHGQAARQDSAACAACHLSRDLANAASAATDSNQDACQSCHQIQMPHPASFLTDHGRAYSANPTLCARCHLTDGQGFNLTVQANPASLPGTPVCKDCHTSRNPHPTSEAVTNPAALAPVRVASHPVALPTNPTCQTCHAGRTHVCASCHQGTDWHPGDWDTTHREAVWKQGPDSCRTCHNTSDACARCHRAGGPVQPQG